MADEQKTENSVQQTPPKADGNAAKPDLLDFLVGLPDSENDLENSSGGEASPPEPQPEPGEKSKEELLAEYIRQQTKASQVVSFASLKAKDDDVDSVLKSLFENSDFADILSTTGQKDVYYYSANDMTTNYAVIAVLVEEKDFPYTVAHMVRYNCKTYPAPTPESYFMNPPYNYTRPQMDRVRDTIKRDAKYEDIQEVVTGNKKVYFYSLPVMTARYALSLAERAETDEYGYRS